MLYRALVDADAVGKRSGSDVAGSLPAGIVVNLDGIDGRVGKPLRHHQRNDTCSGSYVQYPASPIGPCSEQYAVGTHFHATLVLADAELLEVESIFHVFKNA